MVESSDDDRGEKRSIRSSIKINDAEIPTKLSSEGELKPDGGYGWVIVAAVFMTNFMSDGIIFSSGLVLSELIRTYSLPAARVSWIFSLMDAFSLLTGNWRKFMCLICKLKY